MATPITIVDVEKVLLSIAPKDADNRVVPIGDETYTWTSSDESVITLAAGDSDFDKFAVSGAPGVATVTVTDGTLTDAIEITVALGKANSLGLSAGTPIPEV